MKNENSIFISRTLFIFTLLFSLAFIQLFTTTTYAASTNEVGVVKANALNVRSGPGTSYSIIGILHRGSKVTLYENTGKWYKITYKDRSAYISATYVTVTPEPEPDPVPEPIPEVKRDQIVKYAKKFIGTPYRYGGTSPRGFDCSGFAQYVYKHFGISIGRTTRDQIKKGKTVSKSNLKAGDLVFTSRGHVGIYVANGQFIDSPRTGYRISIRKMWSYYAGRRIINEILPFPQ
jgi:cell wall-associated NlpC family hydrolase